MRVVIFHRSRLFASCLAQVLNEPESAGAEAWALDPEQAGLLSRVEQIGPDLVLVDLDLATVPCVELVTAIGERLANARFLALASSEQHPEIAACVRAGVSGLIIEESSLQELRTAIETVLRGDFFCSPPLARSLFKLLASTPEGSFSSELPGRSKLTQRELEIVHLIAQGLSNKQIARELSVSLFTVKNHVHNILDKLQVQSRFEAVDLARRQRLVSRSPR